MNFVIRKGPYQVWHKFTISQADENGDPQDVEIELLFSIPTDEEIEKEFPNRSELLGVLSSADDARDFLSDELMEKIDAAKRKQATCIIDRTIDWRGFKDEAGKDAPFKKATIKQLMGYKYFSDAVAIAFDQARHGRRSGN